MPSVRRLPQQPSLLSSPFLRIKRLGANKTVNGDWPYLGQHFATKMAFIAKTFRKLEDVILNPLVTGPLLLVLTTGPTAIRRPLLSQLAILLKEQNVKRLVVGLKWALALGIVRKISGWLDDVAFTNWQVRPAKDKWVWESETAVVTGGSSGIGAAIAKCLMRKGIKVAVLDVQPLPKDMDGCKFMNTKTHGRNTV